ncbi:MAG: glycosyltransferase family 4 protein [Chloroflexota bacterium]|nr:glycosyltransferase family 4 protein [Chloroflexota bacterium]
MRILFLSNYYPPLEVGGYEQLCRDVAERLAGRGHTIAVLTSTYGLGKEPVGQDVDYDVHRLLRLQPDFDRRLGATLQFFLTRQPDEQYDLACFRKVIAEFDPVVISIWNMQRLPRSLALEAEALPDTGVAYWVASSTPAEPDEFWRYWDLVPPNPWKARFKGLFSDRALRTMQAEGHPLQPEMKHVGVVSNFMRERGIDDGTLPSWTKVIYNGVEIDSFFQPVQPLGEGPMCFLQAGRVSDDKGVHTAIEAVGLAVQKSGLGNVRLVIAGSGPADYRQRLDELVKRYQIEEQVVFTGWLPREQMPALMAESHVLLLPTTHQEPFARVVLEAMASGLAVVATPTGGTEEIVQHGKTGLLFPVGDSKKLTDQIGGLVENDDFRIQLAEAGQHLVAQRYSLEHMVDEIENLLNLATSDGS